MASNQGISLVPHTKIPEQPPSENETSQSTSFNASTFDPSTLKRHLGKTYAFCWYKGEPLFTLGPQWWMFFPTWIMLVLLGAIVYYQLESMSQDSYGNFMIGMVSWEAFIYLLTALKNPGIVTTKEMCDPEDMEIASRREFCKKCNVIKDRKTEHCSDCDICIRGFDHHCPWTGKCIGKGNLWPFYLFLGSTILYLAALILVAIDIPLVWIYKSLPLPEKL